MKASNTGRRAGDGAATADTVARARGVLNAFLAERGLNRSRQREIILDVFVRSGRHLSVDELFELVRKKRSDIGRTTVYRSLRLFVEGGLASELALDGHSRFEVELGRSHHDHFICSACGAIFEFMSPAIERLQLEEAARIGFLVEGHRHQILGRCGNCRSEA